MSAINALTGVSVYGASAPWLAPCKILEGLLYFRVLCHSGCHLLWELPLQHLSVRLHDMPNPRIKAVSEPTPCCAAMSFLIPIGVVVYAAIGGLKSTFSTAYFHTVIVFVLALIFMFKVYVPGDLLGGIDDVSP